MHGHPTNVSMATIGTLWGAILEHVKEHPNFNSVAHSSKQD